MRSISETVRMTYTNKPELDNQRLKMITVLAHAQPKIKNKQKSMKSLEIVSNFVAP